MPEAIDRLLDDIRQFFADIDNGPPELHVVSPSPRLQVVTAQFSGIEWEFQQEFGFQMLLWRNPNYPEAVVNAENVEFYFDPPTKDELRALGRGSVPRFENLRAIARNLRPLMPRILEALESPEVVHMSARLQELNYEIFVAGGGRIERLV